MRHMILLTILFYGAVFVENPLAFPAYDLTPMLRYTPPF